ncbi:MAG: PHP domain-containing protein [Actinomycetota bacterium]|nr:PHP domain-containing protein [Actinomycetota bacterium]MDI6822061.1 PHP domain-containing protein [Actinomycetota bacterium]
MGVDLHLHSTASDGAFSPEELVKFAVKLDFTAIAITDHDSIDGIVPALRRAGDFDIEVIPAVELSSDLEGRDIHFLGYFIDYKQEWFLKHLSKLRQARYERAVKMVERLQEMGLEIALKDVLQEAGKGAVGRAHVARVMVKQGCIDSIEEAFERYIGRKAPCYIEKYVYTPKDVIKLIKRLGGIAILAHPGLSQVDEKIPEFIRYGIQGLEVYHSNHTPDDVRKYSKMAREYGLVITGGSDCHGLGSSRGLIMGSVRVPDEVVENLKTLKDLQKITPEIHLK